MSQITLNEQDTEYERYLELANSQMIKVIHNLRDAGMDEPEIEAWVLETLELY